MIVAPAHCLEVSNIDELRAKTPVVFDLVWRFDLEAPGFAVIDVGPSVDSHTLRAWMVELKKQLSDLAVQRGRQPFAYLSMARFDQQETTKFHLDGAPPESLLMLGYEPSRIPSRLFLADYIRAAKDLGITPEQYLQDFNPMFSQGEEHLVQYATELPQPIDGHSRILLVNNSSLSPIDGGPHPLGVMHKAVVETPNRDQPRIINSTMLATGIEDFAMAAQQEFVSTNHVSRRAY